MVMFKDLTQDKKLEEEKRKRIITDIINTLSMKSSEIYHLDSNSIAVLIHDYIHGNKLEAEKYKMVKSLSRDDILDLMEFRTKCC